MYTIFRCDRVSSAQIVCDFDRLFDGSSSGGNIDLTSIPRSWGSIDAADGIDAIDCCYVSIGDYVWFDMDGDREQDGITRARHQRDHHAIKKWKLPL